MLHGLSQNTSSESHVDKLDVSARWRRVMGTVEKMADLNKWHRNEVRISQFSHVFRMKQISDLAAHRFSKPSESS